MIAVLRSRNSLGPVLTLPARPLRWVLLTAPDDPGAVINSVAMVGPIVERGVPHAGLVRRYGTLKGFTDWMREP